ncbi:dipeptide epimerase [Acuticoccus sp. MNP-M23]|uniref:N-acetyl-D-Glu racemase DgcA n=1 Tax=Acuticoccus sp. MNP-M23 TaxID=3072793 RepID=UPI002814FA75|nr:N-acetyl-D-Glu racemase DgcA [Acuticoccus sp. MNP-M23]WMS41203.1 dipeptide epimerase [Acuticoccus sp. MNP-M23]
MRQLTVRAETFPIRGSFRISRESRTEAKVVVAEITHGELRGRGECVPYPRYRESVEGVVADIEAQADAIGNGMSSAELQSVMPAGAARCALDCALLDFESKLSGQSVADRFGIQLAPVTTAYTISLGEPDAMAEAAAACGHKFLKIKLGLSLGDDDRIRAVRNAVPDALLVVDANEGWGDSNLLRNMSACAAAGVALVEQPLPAVRDGVLATLSHPVPICADESAHTAEGIAKLKGRYDAVNVKLNKAGGLTEALKMVETARAADLKVMLGCMLGTSLAMAPAVLAAQNVDFVDLDGPLLLERDRDEALHYEGALLHPPARDLWG